MGYNVMDIWSINKKDNDQKRKEIQQQIKDLEPEFKSAEDVYYKRYGNPKRFYEKMNNFKPFILLVNAFLAMIAMLVMSIVSSQTDSTSYKYMLNEDQAYISQDVEVKVIYYHHFNNLEHETIEVLIKNVSNQTIQSAKVTEKTNNISGLLTNLAPNEDTFVILQSNSKEKLKIKEFKFDVSDINF